MNHNKIYHDIVNGIEKEKPEANDLQKDLLAGDHSEWIENPVTKRFLSAVENCLAAKLDGAMEGSVAGSSSDELKKQLIQTQTLKKIIQYASTEITTTGTLIC